jgi:unsaturated rhamnogalacturonyl hydrolase
MRFNLLHSLRAVSKCSGLRTFEVALAWVFVIGTAYCQTVSSVPLAWSQKMAKSTMQRWSDGRFVPSGTPWLWDYQLGVLSNGMAAVWYNTADGAYFEYMKRSVDPFVAADGSISTYNAEANSLDDILLGRQLLLLYRVTRDTKYYKAATLLRKQLTNQQRNASGGFWHKKIDPNEMLLDDEYMVDPFYAEYAYLFHQPQDFVDITRQFALLEQHTRDPKTGLLYQAWDETHQQAWANKVTGTSQTFWARGMGWYMMALVDTLPYYPQGDPGRATLVAILNRTAAALVRYQDNKTGLWYQVLDKPNNKGNYFESSAACMFAYALAKGVRLGYLPQSYSENATRAWQGILTHFVHTEADGSVDISGTVKGIDLGGNPSHDGSYEYYVDSPVVTNDPKAIGSFLLAGTEMELIPTANLGRGESVLLDAWFNGQKRRNAAGVDEYFHYKWNDYSSDGLSLFGHIFRSYGVKTETLYSAPTYDILRHAQFYIIVSPDIPAKNPDPRYLQQRDADRIARWVNEGGALILMENDPANADITHLDRLSDVFGLHFNEVLSHHAIRHDLAAGSISVNGTGPVFHSPHMLFMKDTCTISAKSPAVSVLRDKGDILMGTAKYGKGTVFAVVDPWLYNEYTDGRKLPKAYDNFAAGEELVRWLLQQVAGERRSLPIR